MSGAQHTPGEWYEVDGVITSDALPGRNTIATMASWLPHAQEEQDANARLIAAAPELLEACRAAQRYNAAIAGRAADGAYEVDAKGALAEGADLDALYMDWMTKVHAAIAKAAGAQHG